MAIVIRERIVSEVHAAKYFCVILDITPDVTHIDQLAFSVQYVLERKPVERFLCFDKMVGAKATDFLNKLLHLLAQFNLDPKLIRGQAMDGCSTMSGIRRGLQALFREVSPFALHVHCMAHRLNLVLVKAATICIPVKSFFGCSRVFTAFLLPVPEESRSCTNRRKAQNEVLRCQNLFPTHSVKREQILYNMSGITLIAISMFLKN